MEAETTTMQNLNLSLEHIDELTRQLEDGKSTEPLFAGMSSTEASALAEAMLKHNLERVRQGLTKQKLEEALGEHLPCKQAREDAYQWFTKVRENSYEANCRPAVFQKQFLEELG